jgi:4-hydroxybenzoate polyprenyltransferase
MLIGRVFGRTEAFRLHLAFNIFGVILGFISAWLAGNIKLGFIFVVVAGLLWFYAKTFKKIFLLGNIMVGLVTALTILITLFFETWLFNNPDELILRAAYDEMMIPSVFAYALFAFITTVIREIIKDIEDVEGDSQFDCKTVPIVLGLKGTKWTVGLFCILLVVMLFFVQGYFFREDQFLKISYILIALQLPVVAFIFSLVSANAKDDFAKLSEWMKIVMLLGILSMAVFYYV